MKFLLTDVRYFVIEAADAEMAAELYEAAFQDYNEDEYEVEVEDNAYIIQPMNLQ